MSRRRATQMPSVRLMAYALSHRQRRLNRGEPFGADVTVHVREAVEGVARPVRGVHEVSDRNTGDHPGHLCLPRAGRVGHLPAQQIPACVT